MKRIAIIGGGIAGLTAAYELARLARDGAQVEAVLFESSNRFGGLIETVREGGFTIEAGPDGWVSAKPWARELAIELGLESELIPSNDATRRTHIFLTTPENPSGRLLPMPDGLNLMVPTNLEALNNSPLFTESAIAAYRAEPARADELLAAIPSHDESVADFTLRHFGPEVLARVAAPLLSGVFGGDVRKLSVRAVMPAFVQLERTHGSLIAGLQSVSQPATDNLQPATIFTTLRSGLGTLIDRLVATIPPHWLRLNTIVTAIEPNSYLTEKTDSPPWIIHTSTTGKHRGSDTFDAVLLATPLDATRRLLTPLDSAAAQVLPTESSSAVLVAFAYLDAARVPLPPGFGFLVPPIDPVMSTEGGALAGEVERPPHFAFGSSTSVTSITPSLLLACTFTDQKFPHRVPPGGRLVRAFFRGAAANRIARCNNDEIAAIARLELARILNSTAPISAVAPTPAPVPALTVVRRSPNSLPQYAVGHLDRVAEIESRLRAHPGLTLLGNALHGVGLPDLIRDARQAARTAVG
jgi:oxygen-dependent protoporphyrinogen oxidase